MTLEDFDKGVLADVLAHTCRNTKFCPNKEMLKCPLNTVCKKPCKAIEPEDWMKLLGGEDETEGR